MSDDNARPLTFSEALVHIRQGRKAARQGWLASGVFVFLVPGSTFKVNRPPLLGLYPEGHEITYGAHIDMCLGPHRVVTWAPQQYDLLSDDWLLLD